ncbi:MAG: Rpn family recombination-promoting nuclease/putative transposase [Polyangiaceae bacterium]|nr:Rpn family recombination-promoting nuclease/putative transposase [Polyangiaceae bacterium]
MAALDLKGLELEEGSFVDPAIVQRHLDLLYSVPFADGRGWAFMHVLFEHQSSDDPLMAFRSPLSSSGSPRGPAWFRAAHPMGTEGTSGVLPAGGDRAHGRRFAVSGADRGRGA